MFAVTLSTPVYDPLGSVELAVKSDTELASISRRVTRTATLDGGATIEDLGYCAADTTLDFQVIVRSRDDEDRLMRLVRIYPLLVLASRYGAFLGVVDYYKPQSGGASLRFLIHTQLSP